MKLIKQTKLYFKQGNSDKVYEADLCEVGEGQYIVNFRYGRKGNSLNEGSKTVFPVSLEEAEKVYEKLVSSKTKKGYQEEVQQTNVTPTIATPEVISTSDDGELTPEQARKKAVLAHLAGQAGGRKWAISRAMWRAGELYIKEATPHILKLLSFEGTEMHEYSGLWALGRCGSSQPEVVARLQKGYQSDDDKIKRIAANALVLQAKGKERRAFLNGIIAKLPTALQDQVRGGNPQTLLRLMNEYKQNPKNRSFSFITDLYLLTDDYAHIRTALATFIRDLPFQAGYFRYLRHIFKAAELRQDGQIYGLMAYRIEAEKENFKIPKYSSSSVWIGRKWYKPKQELKKDNSALAYSNKTRDYLTRRISRTLKRFADLEDLNYIKVATGILLQFDDKKDLTTARKIKRWSYSNKTRRWTSRTTHFDTYSKFNTLYQILYGNSKRYQFDKVYKEWVCVNGFIPGTAEPKDREELHPHLWDQMPQALTHLIIGGKSERVIDFALRAFRANPKYKEYEARFDLPLVIQLIKKSARSANLFGLELALKRYDAANPQLPLVLAMINSEVAAIREQAFTWISDNYSHFFSETGFVKDLMTHESKAIRSWMSSQLNDIIKHLDANKRRILTTRIVGHIMNMRGDNQNILVKEYADMLSANFAEELRNLNVDVLGDMLEHPLVEAQLFATRCLVNHNVEPDRLPVEYVQRLINSNTAELRGSGIELLKGFSDMALAAQQDLLIKCSISKLADLRTAVRPLIGKLAKNFDDFAAEAVHKYLPILLRKETYEGLHEDVFKLLSNELEQHLHIVERKMIFRLLNSDHSKANGLACILVDRYVPAKSLTMRSIIRFADHEILAARQLAAKMFNNNIARVKYERDEAVRILDAKWDDARAFAFDFFRKNFTKEDWTPQLLVSICDSVRKDVQAFGRELITKFFEDDHGEEYLTKLSQHPRPELQLFATNYLERFATDNIDRIKDLDLYFITILSHVNKARVAKDRILQFLYKESMKHHEVAALFANILDRLSATVAIGDKGMAIAMMRDIHEKYPNIDVPLTFKAAPVYTK
ncbi:MAG: WGR domain-containing protein [Aureispira sp.]|nr:WGR domain-containing protein [Aureispira sp.]